MAQPVETQAAEPSALAERARRLVPALQERAAAAEQERRLPAETVGELLDAGLIGPGEDRQALLEATIELARGCGSTAWCFALWSLAARRLAAWPGAAREEVFGAGPGALVCTASAGEDLRCEATAAGFRVSGRARLAAGCDHSDWLLLPAPATDGAVELLLPRSDFEIVAASGERSGLRAAGSRDLRLDAALVPAHRARTAPDRGEDPADPGPAGWAVPCVTIGLAAAALEATLERLRGTSGKARSADSPVVHLLVSECAADIDAARALMRGDLDAAGGEAGRCRRNRAFGAELAMRAVDRTFYIAGGRAISVRDPLQRIHRDAHASLHPPDIWAGAAL